VLEVEPTGQPPVRTVTGSDRDGNKAVSGAALCPQNKVCVQHYTSAANVPLPAFAAECRVPALLLLLRARQQSINISCPLGTQHQQSINQ